MLTGAACLFLLCYTKVECMSALTLYITAGAVAERALTTINFRHQDEKFNMWVAWLNLENAYGTPPEEAVMALFQKALQYTDPKKMYLALLGILERSKREELCQQVLRTMTRKFSSSAKVITR